MIMNTENRTAVKPLMELRSVTRVFFSGKENEVRALRHIDLCVERGDMIAVTGPSGSGKSTLLHILAMLDLPTRGKYRYDGQDTAKLSEAARARLRGAKIGIVLQDYGMIRELTAADNVEIPLLIAGRKSSEIKEAVKKALEKVGLSDKLHVKAALLSGGEQQRVAIARAVASGAEVILADEPTGALDTATTKEIMDLLQKLNEEGKTVIVVTHNAYVADRCRRRIRIRDGYLQEEEQAKE
ncbi:MAG: ABC transporter ATP-binding protein [Lachnospiraceae bacterium]|nr:ABC transporter ATP-binding protein [Lachnospiraceae bacterium]